MRTYIIFLATLFPHAGLPLGLYGLCKDYKNWHTYVLCIALFFGAVAYAYTPATSSDLVRYIDYINSISNLSLEEAMREGIYGSNVQALFGFVLMSWLIAQIGDPHLISAVTVFVIYYIGLRITCQIGADFKINISRIVLHVILLITISNFYALANNIRNVFAFSLITLAVFRECYDNKKNIFTYFLYIFPIFVHPASIAILALRVIVGFHYGLKILFSLFILCSYYLVGFFFNHGLISFSGNIIITFLNMLIVKSYNYFYDTTSEFGLSVAASPSEQLFKIFYIGFTVVIAIYSLLLLRKIKKEKNTKLINISKLINFEMYLCFLTVACAPMLRPEYWRFAAISILCSAPVCLFGDSYLKKRLYTQLFLLGRFLFVPVCFALWARNFIRYTDLSESFINSIFTSPILIFIIDLGNKLLLWN